MEDQSPEVVQKQMEETRESLSSKVAALEEKVTGTIGSANTSVQETVESVKEAIHETVESVKQSLTGSVEGVKQSLTGGMTDAVAGVKDLFDLSPRVRANPLPALGIAALSGLITGLLVFGRRSGAASAAPATAYTPAPAYQPAKAPSAPSFELPDFVTKLIHEAEEHLMKIGREAISTAAESLRSNVGDKVPHLIDGAFSNLHRESGVPPAGPREMPRAAGS